MSGAPTRRGLLLGGAALLLAPRPALAQDRTAAALERLLACEELAARAYVREGMATLGARTREHVRALEPQLEAIGLLEFEVRGDELPAAARVRLGDGASALALERALAERCRAGLAAIEVPAVRRTVATVLAGHAQHLVVLAGDPLTALM